MADNALLVESRFILTDSMLMLFGLGAVHFYLIARSIEGRRRWVWWSPAVLSGGAAASIKWTGLTALALVAATWVWDRRHHFKKEWRRLLGEAAILDRPRPLQRSDWSRGRGPPSGCMLNTGCP